MIKQTEWQSVLDKLNESLSELGNLEIDTDHKFENCGKLHVVTVVGMFLLIDSTERSESWVRHQRTAWDSITGITGVTGHG